MFVPTVLREQGRHGDGQVGAVVGPHATLVPFEPVRALDPQVLLPPARLLLQLLGLPSLLLIQARTPVTGAQLYIFPKHFDILVSLLFKMKI